MTLHHSAIPVNCPQRDGTLPKRETYTVMSRTESNLVPLLSCVYLSNWVLTKRVRSCQVHYAISFYHGAVLCKSQTAPIAYLNSRLEVSAPIGALINQRMLDTKRASEDCLLSTESLARASRPTITGSGQWAPGLRFGQPQVRALFAGISRFLPALNGFHNVELQESVHALRCVSHEAHTASQMSYDLRRLRLTGVIARLAGTHRHILTSYRRRIPYLMTTLHNHIPDVASAASSASAAVPSQLAQALQQLGAELDRLVAEATLASAKT